MFRVEHTTTYSTWLLCDQLWSAPFLTSSVTLTLKKKVCLGQEPWALVLRSLLTPSGSAFIGAPLTTTTGVHPPQGSLLGLLSREFHPSFLLRVLLDPGRLTYPDTYRLLCLLWEQCHLLMSWILAEKVTDQTLLEQTWHKLLDKVFPSALSSACLVQFGQDSWWASSNKNSPVSIHNQITHTPILISYHPGLFFAEGLLCWSNKNPISLRMERWLSG